jgi:hypothetical protein
MTVISVLYVPCIDFCVMLLVRFQRQMINQIRLWYYLYLPCNFCYNVNNFWYCLLLYKCVFSESNIHILFISLKCVLIKSYKWKTYCSFVLCVWFTGTIVVRILIFPLVIVAQRNAANMSVNLPQLQTLQLKMTEARQSGNQLEGNWCLSIISVSRLRVNWVTVEHWRSLIIRYTCHQIWIERWACLAAARRVNPWRR